MAVTVTATQGGSTANGIALRVMVLTQAAATQNGASVTANAAVNASITTTQTGSRVYGAAIRGVNSALTAFDSNTTMIDAIADATNTEYFGTFKATSATGTPGAVTLGCGAGTSDNGVAMFEVKTSGTLTEDGSGPAAVSDLTHTFVTTASFTPPAGSLLVALISSDGGAAQTTMAVTDTGGGYTWVAQAQANTAGSDYAGVFTAQVPASVKTPPLPLQPPAQPPQPQRPPPSQVVPAPVSYQAQVILSGSGTLTTTAPGVGGLPQLITPVIQPPQPRQPPPGQVVAFTPGAFISAATLSGSGTLSASYTVVITGGSALIQSGPQPPQPPQPPPGQITGSAPLVTFTVGATLSGTGTLSVSYTLAGTAPYVVTPVIQPPQPRQPPPGQVVLGPAPLLVSTVLSGSGTLTAAPFFSGAATLSGSGTLSASYTLAGTAPYVIVPVTQPPQPAQPPRASILGVPPPPPPPVLQDGTIAATVTEGTTMTATVTEAATTTATVTEAATIAATVT